VLDVAQHVIGPATGVPGLTEESKVSRPAILKTPVLQELVMPAMTALEVVGLRDIEGRRPLSGIEPSARSARKRLNSGKVKVSQEDERKSSHLNSRPT
jgi:hypothetical protein